MRSLDEEIARHLQEALSSGELSQAPSYGKPLHEADGWDETPADLRMPFKILKDAGVPPPCCGTNCDLRPKASRARH